MSNMVKIRIDGRAVEAPVGSTILDVARREGIYIPTLCHSPLLRPLENCRLCVVKVAGEKKFKAACSTEIIENMDITTQDEDLQQTRKFLLELILDTHYGDCVAPCSVKCPANVDIQGYLAHIRLGEYRQGVLLIKEKIPMPATIGRVCPHTCETVCRRHLVDEPIGINMCKRFLADYELKSGERILPEVPAPSTHRVAIIGGGPAGLSAAYYLRCLGHASTIFEAKEKLGGMLRYGIPEYRLPKKILDWEIEGILSLGIDVKTGVRWGRDFTLDDLKKEGFDAIFIGVGAWASRKLGIAGEELEGVVPGVDFLEKVAEGSLHGGMTVGKRVAIIGGGNVAIDAARCSLRLGAEQVTILYRRSRKEMPASDEEIEAALEEGVEIQFLVAPTHLYGENGHLKKLEYIRMELGEPDASGRRRPVPIEGSEVTIEVDQVISAIGQYPMVPQPDMDAQVSNLALTRWGTFGGDPGTLYTGQEMVFVGGDVFRGPDTVVAAFADGRKAAYSLDRYFRAGEVQPEPVHFNINKGNLESIDREPFNALQTASRESMAELEPRERTTNFLEVELGLTEEQAKKEAERCLVCGCSAAFDCRLRDLMDEFQVDWRDQPSKKIPYQQVAAVDVHPEIAFDPNKCIRCERCYVGCSTYQVSDAIDLKEWPRINDRCVSCGLCVDLCPTGALMEKRNGRPVDRLDWESSSTHCIHCGCGCQLDLKLKGDRLAWISDGSSVAPNWASTCRKGRFHTYDALWFGDRVVKPKSRHSGKLREVSWPKAIQEVLDGFTGVKERHGPGALGALASARASNEALYLLQKWMRIGWECTNLDFPERQLRERLLQIAAQYKSEVGLCQEFSALDKVKAILVCGDSVEEEAPIIATMIRRAARSRGVPVWQIASGSDAITPFCSAAFHCEPSSWPALLRGIVKAMGGQTKDDFKPSEAGINVESWEHFLKTFSAAPSIAIVFPERLLDNGETADAVEAIYKLASVAGCLQGQNGSGIYPITGLANSSGALLMGMSPYLLPGFMKVSDRRGAKKFMRVWEVDEIPQKPGLSIEEALERGEIKGLFVQQPSALWEKDAAKWKKLFSGLEFLVIQDDTPTQVSRLANVILPAAAFGEQLGTIVNMEWRLLELQKVFAEREKCLADWEILLQIMSAQGLPFPEDLAAIRSEMSALIPQLKEIDWNGGIKEKIRLAMNL